MLLDEGKAQTNYEKNVVFHKEEPLLDEGSLPVSEVHGPEANKWLCQGAQIESHAFYQGKGAINAKIKFKH